MVLFEGGDKRRQRAVPRREGFLPLAGVDLIQVFSDALSELGAVRLVAGGVETAPVL